MDKEQAILLMKAGKKVTHHYFSKEEWMTMQGNRVVLEDGCSLWAHEFWADRSSSAWDEGYSVFTELTMKEDK